MSGGYGLYLDTSALLRLYLADERSDDVEEAAEGATEVYVSSILELEARVSLARAYHAGRLTDDALSRLLDKLASDLEGGYHVVAYDSELASRAGELARKRGGLRSYDALHLASALATFEDVTDGRFLTFDRGLVQAARGGVNLYLDPFPENDDE